MVSPLSATSLTAFHDHLPEQTAWGLLAVGTWALGATEKSCRVDPRRPRHPVAADPGGPILGHVPPAAASGPLTSFSQLLFPLRSWVGVQTPTSSTHTGPQGSGGL